MEKIKKLILAVSAFYSLNIAGNFAVAQIKDEHAKIVEQSRISADSLRKEEINYAKELLDLEKKAGFDVQLFHYKFLDSLINETGKYIVFGAVDKSFKKIQVINNLVNIDLGLKKNNFSYKEDADLLFYEALKTKNFNSFQFLALYLEVASKKNLPIFPMKIDEHFFAKYSLDSLNSINWETAFGIEQPKDLSKKFIKNLTKEEFLSGEYRTIGFYLYKDKQFQKSIEYFNKAIEIDSTDYLAYKYLGDCYDVLGEYNNALKNYDMAINLAPSFTQAYADRGNVFYKKNKLEKALKDYNQAIKLAPENPEFYKIRGDIYSRLYGEAVDKWSEKIKPEKAQKDYEKALELILKK